MKKLAVTLLIFMSPFFVAFSYGQETKWDYPVKPGTEQWKSFQTTPEILTALQIPDEILKSLSTEELLTICLNYPLFTSYIFSNSPFEGMNGVVQSFNGFEAFSSRNNMGEVLLSFYERKQISEIGQIEKGIDKASFKFYHCGIELLLCNNKIISKLSKDQQTNILKLVMKKYVEKLSFMDSFGFWGKMTSAFVGNKYASLLGKQDADSDEQLKNAKKLFSERMLMTDLKVVDVILVDVDKFVKELK